MTKRNSIPESVKQQVLLKSKRRCALCYVEGRTEPRPGDIAHIDKNSDTPELENLVFLCAEHHRRVDQTGVPAPTEIRAARAKLYADIKREPRRQVRESRRLEYEEHVCELVRKAVADRLGDFFSLKSHALYRGRSGVSHEVDLAVEFVVAGIRYVTVFEIKHTRGKIGVQDVLLFASTSEDIGVDKSVFVSNGGFTPAAARVARTSDIVMLYVFEDCIELPDAIAQDVSQRSL